MAGKIYYVRKSINGTSSIIAKEKLLHIPVSTYRLQFNAKFPLKNAIALIPYFSKLGISDIYSSPITRAIPGSQHGYDVINPTRLNPEICNLNHLTKFSHLLHRSHMSLLMDFVPNHMAASNKNKWWQDVLRKGRSSPYAHFFDINWRNKKNFTYRRFFDINELVCLRVEDNTVFNEIHSLIWTLIKKKIIDGLRIDHIDGLYNPTVYLNHLNNKTSKLNKAKFYILVEKILAYDERLPPQWPIEGTTGYDFLDAVNAIFVDKSGYQHLVENYKVFTGLNYRWPEIRYQSKKQVIEELFQSETNQLVNSIIKMAKLDPSASQCHRQDFKLVIEELTAALPLYRTYINSSILHKDDKKYLHQAVRLARKKLGKNGLLARQFVEKVLFLKIPSRKSAT